MKISVTMPPPRVELPYRGQPDRAAGRCYNSRMIRAVVFDCFGVILADASAVLLRELAARDPQKAREAVGLVAAVNRGMLSRQDYDQRLPALFGMTAEQYRTHLTAREIKDQALLDYAKSLRTQYRTALLSNISHAGFWRRFTPEELAPYFDEIVLSADIGHAKPDPQAYEITAGRLGVRPDECVLVDDQELYCEGARAAGMRAILYTRLDQLKRDLEPILLPAQPLP